MHDIKNKIYLPKLHPAQQEILENAKRFNTVCCGRRFGKNVLLENIIVTNALQGKRVGHLEPTFSDIAEVWRDINQLLKPAIKNSNGSEMRIELNTGGIIEFWSLQSYDSIRGRKYHVVTLNEAAKSRYLEDAWKFAIRPTLTDYKGDAWFFSTPKGEDYFKELHFKEDQNWYHVSKTSYDNPKLDAKEIDDARFDLPELVFRQEYLAEFVTNIGTRLNKTHIKYFDLDNVNLNELDIVMGIDLAISQKTTADYTVILTLAKNRKSGDIFVLDVFRDRLNFNQTMLKIEEIEKIFKPKTIAIEQVAYQAAIVQELIRTTKLNVKGVRPDKDKLTRFETIQSRFEHGLVYINKDINKTFVDELLSFPIGRNDDQVDALALAYFLISKGIPGFLF
jgi:predicted phage terminase large subunit-like protein